ncbi:hypothetical protein QN399_19345 [Pseudomonas sp. 10C3]|uniref:hypothetical protein n=1 Tax=Pseudomonas sp. 10C3 TaxID=3118753 RepID=UPI002E810610|nr:hypothetical protein [Pseudomonas sp. 10C3]MEE3508379.1 hypothetical protein [Pseudomonas sp. 10C3]
MPLMIDAETLLSLLSDVDTAKIDVVTSSRRCAYRANEQPRDAQTEQFLKGYQAAYRF